MTETMWTSVPAGDFGRGTADVRPYPGVVVRPAADTVQGTGLPAGGFAAEARSVVTADTARLRAQHGPVAVLSRADAPVAQKFVAEQSTQNDDTTLGIHTPGRPRS